MYPNFQDNQQPGYYPQQNQSVPFQPNQFYPPPTSLDQFNQPYPQYPPQQPPQYPQYPPQYPPQQPQYPEYPAYPPQYPQNLPPQQNQIYPQIQLNKQEEELKAFQEIAAKLDPDFKEKLEKQKLEQGLSAGLNNLQINYQGPPSQQYNQQQQMNFNYNPQHLAPIQQNYQPPQYNYINLLLPPNETNQQINPLTGSKMNAKHERDDFHYIGQKDLQGYEKFQQLFDQLQKSGKQFKDNEFPSELSSLIEKEGSRYKYIWKKYGWKRPSEFYKGEFYLFIKSLNTFQYNDPKDLRMTRMINNLKISSTGLEGIEPDDIKQGELGDCYFLATLSAIAEFPWRIKQLFVTRKVNNNGIYCVKFCHFGEWQTVIIDDYFPCNSNGPAFTRGNDNEIWVLILEKAWAKIFGSYERIEAGLTREALKSLTGAPTAVVWTDCPENELWDEIQNGDKQNYIMTCGSQEENKLTQAEAEKMGLVMGHAYTLIGCAVHKGAKLILLRNPWGSKEWKGKWSDSENIWTTELRKELNHNPDANDGTFYIELKDFRKFFADMQICYYKDGYQYSSYKVKSNSRNATLIRMKVQEASDYYISINQESKRMFSEIQNYQYSVCKILIAKIDPRSQALQWIGGKQYSDREFWVNVNLTPGEYLVYVKSYWFDQQPRSFVLSSYGKNQVQFVQANKSQFPAGIVESIMKTHPMQKIQNYKELNGLQKNFEIYLKEGFGVFWVKNMTQKPFSTKVTLTKMNGLKLRKPFQGNVIQLTANPGQEAIALVNVNYKGYSLGFQEQYQY